MKFPVSRKVIAGAALVSLTLGYYFYSSDKNPQGDLEYSATPITRGDIVNMVVTTGKVKAVGMVEVGSQISGQIASIYVDFNSEVKKGQLLAEIDPRTYEGRVKQSEAQLEIAKASVLQQEAVLARSIADHAEAKRLLVRQQRLGAASYISESELDRLQTALTAAAAQVTIAEAQVANAKASVIQAEASLFQARIDLERCQIRSPVDGIVINRVVEEGQTVAASMTAPVLFTIAQDMSQMQVEASVDEADIGKVQPDQAASFTVEAFPDKRFRGTVTQVRKAANEELNVVTYTVIISADNRDASLLPGMTATVEVITGEKQDVLRVPNMALRFRPPNTDPTPADPRAAFIDERVRGMSKQLGLDTTQEKAIRKLFQDRMASMARPSGGMVMGAPGNTPPQGGRPAMFDDEQLRALLTEQQFEEYRRLAASGFGGGRSSGRAELGEIWVLDDAGRLQRQSVRIGLRGDEYTEIMNAEHLDGARAVVRATRRQAG